MFGYQTKLRLAERLAWQWELACREEVAARTRSEDKLEEMRAERNELAARLNAVSYLSGGTKSPLEFDVHVDVEGNEFGWPTGVLLPEGACRL